MPSALSNRIDLLVAELREIGMPISVSDKVDALRALTHVSIDDRETFKLGLEATLVKSSDHIRTFEAVFELFFSDRGALPQLQPEQSADTGAAGPAEAAPAPSTSLAPPSALAQASDEDITAILDHAIRTSDLVLLRMVAREGVSRFGRLPELSGSSAGSSGGGFSVVRTLRALHLSAVEAAIRESIRDDLAAERFDQLGAALAEGRLEDDLRLFRSEVEAEVRMLTSEQQGGARVASCASRCRQTRICSSRQCPRSTRCATRSGRSVASWLRVCAAVGRRSTAGHSTSAERFATRWRTAACQRNCTSGRPVRTSQISSSLLTSRDRSLPLRDSPSSCCTRSDQSSPGCAALCSSTESPRSPICSSRPMMSIT